MMTTKSEQEENQWKQYRWEQEQIKSMKEYIARKYFLVIGVDIIITAATIVSA